MVLQGVPLAGGGQTDARGDSGQGGLGAQCGCVQGPAQASGSLCSSVSPQRFGLCLRLLPTPLLRSFVLFLGEILQGP